MKDRIGEIVFTLQERSTALARREGERDAAVKRSSEAAEKLAECSETRARAAAAHHVLQTAAESLRERMKVELEHVATRVLRYVFQRDYKVEFKVEVKHGQVCAECWVSEDGVASKAVGGHGGGVLDVLAYILRVTVLRSMDGRKVLLADEPFKFVNSPDAMDRIRELAAEISKGGVQQVFVSSRDDMASVDGAKVFRFVPSKDGTKIEV
jgi:hypothetical protein